VIGLFKLTKQTYFISLKNRSKACYTAKTHINTINFLKNVN
jgi:hypothetical protein